MYCLLKILYTHRMVYLILAYELGGVLFKQTDKVHAMRIMTSIYAYIMEIRSAKLNLTFDCELLT